MSNPLQLYMTYSFLRLLTQPWEDTDAYKLGIIDQDGIPLKKTSDLRTSEERDAYTVWHRLVWKLKRLLERVPFGKTLIGSYVAALWLIKENVSNRANFDDLLKEFCKLHGVTQKLAESNEQNVALDPGSYVVTSDFVDGLDYQEVIEITETLSPVGNLLGVDVYRFEGSTFTRYDIFPITPTLSEEVTGISSSAGIRPGDEAPGPAKLVRRSKFAGMDVFDCDDDVFHRCKDGKAKYHRYDKYVGEDETGQEIRNYGLKNPKTPIILRHAKTGAMIYLRHPEQKKGW